tara:strand:+ start:1789 stop:2373 length:585 start_codon:yes stop_codon:yes gene_type:complete
MEMTGEFHIPAPQADVWAALNDPEVLQQSIPGAESVEKTSDTEFAAVAKAKVGPVSAKFKGNVTLSDIDAPNGYKISGEGSGGAAGFAKGFAVVKLTPDGDGTLLSYEVQATVGGKLAQVGQRFIDSTAKKMADEFFTSFAAITGGTTEDEVDAIAPTHVPLVPDEEAGLGLAPWMWGTLVIAGALIAIYVATM